MGVDFDLSSQRSPAERGTPQSTDDDTLPGNLAVQAALSDMQKKARDLRRPKHHS
jgi:hypothetical protein